MRCYHLEDATLAGISIGMKVSFDATSCSVEPLQNKLRQCINFRQAWSLAGLKAVYEVRT